MSLATIINRLVDTDLADSYPLLPQLHIPLCLVSKDQLLSALNCVMWRVDPDILLC